MEIGAVKQAFNNEIILLKKNLNQAKIQTIHKLTRKAKTLTEKKVPDAQKEKLKRKAESAVKEVLIIKKIKARDVARFIVTHTGKLNEFLNKPIVDNNKACARLLLHKALQEKYKHIREKFSGISIKDLFMSRQERRKLKKEAREKQKNKKKGKDKKDKSDAVNVEGEWNVEMTDVKNITSGDTTMSDEDLQSEINKSDDENEKSDEESDNNMNGSEINDESENEKSICDDELEEKVSNDDDLEEKVSNGVQAKPLVLRTNESDMESSSQDSNDVTVKNKVEKTETVRNVNYSKRRNKDTDLDSTDRKKASKKEKTDKKEKIVNEKLNIDFNFGRRVNEEDNSISNVKNKKPNTSKNKNLKNKLENRNFHKESDETPNEVTKMVDPFFITSTGENYVSLVEPRQPDEVKEVHKQGNRQYRRAVMFGHVPKPKPRRNNFEPRNNDFKKNNNMNGSVMDSNFKNNKFNQNNRSFNKNTDRNLYSSKDDPAPEKLHPSWEAKKKQSGILPFKGKKIVFDES